MGLLAGALLTVLATIGWAAGIGRAAPADGDSSAVNRYGACLAAQKAGDLLILVDESGSLKRTDAQAARVDAAKYLVRTLGGYADRTGSNLDVAIAGFADDYGVRQDFTPLTGTSADAVNDQLATLAQRDTGADTDYLLALDGARQTLADRAQGKPNRCQAIAWFSDGKLDFSPRPGGRPYAPGVDLGSQAGVDEMIRRATDSICRAGGLADQLRSAGVVMLGVGLGDQAASSDFDVMSAITTGAGPNGTRCGSITDPKPGAFFQVANIDEMLFAFDALNPTPGIEDSKPVCREKVCEEARHNFVLDGSVTSVNILGSGGMPGIVPYLISPGGQQLQLPKKDGTVDVDIDGMPVSYQWQSESAQTIAIHANGSPKWPGQWAVVYVDTTGQHPDAASRVAIHISTDIFPALKDNPATSWRSGQMMKGVRFGLVDGHGQPIDPNRLAGDATMSAVLAVDGAAPIQLLDSVPKTAIDAPVDIDLTDIKPGPATLRMSLVITTAPPPDGPGPGTTLSPQQVEKPVQILPRLGLPAPGQRIDFGTVQGTKGATTKLEITGPGCVWIDGGQSPAVKAAPEGLGVIGVTSAAAGPDSCLKLDAGQKAGLPVTLHTEHDAHGGLAGTVTIHIAPKDDAGRPDTVDVAFTASLVKALSTTNFLLVFVAALLLGPGLPLALLYLTKWYAGKIPDAPMLAERIPVEVAGDEVLRDGQPFEMADTDLVTPVPGLGGGARKLMVAGVHLATVVGRNPFGTAYVRVTAPGYLTAGSELPSTDRTGLQAVLPLAVHGTWVVLHDPGGPPDRAEVVLMVAGQSDIPQRRKLYHDVERRLPELLTELRQHATAAGLTTAGDGAEPESPFGAAPVPQLAGDPFADTHGDNPFEQFRGEN